MQKIVDRPEAPVRSPRAKYVANLDRHPAEETNGGGRDLL
jgi:hypothetical protein